MEMNTRPAAIEKIGCPSKPGSARILKNRVVNKYILIIISAQNPLIIVIVDGYKK